MSSSSGRSSGSRSRGKSPTVTEYMLVAMVAGSIGVMAVPQGEQHVQSIDLAGMARAQQVQVSLTEFRDALTEYHVDHGMFPGYAPGRPGSRVHGGVSGIHLRNQLEGWSDVWGNSSRFYLSRFSYGPYLLYGIPENPINGLNTIRVLSDEDEFPMDPTEETGWIYKPLSGELRPNCSGSIPTSGIRLYDL